jgi:hypothetical protein
MEDAERKRRGEEKRIGPQRRGEEAMKARPLAFMARSPLYNLHPRADPGTTMHENVRRRRVDAEARVSSRVSHDGTGNTISPFPASHS